MPSSALLEAPIPPGGHCGSAPPDLSDHQSNPLCLPHRIHYRPDLAPLIDTKVQEKVHEAEEKKLAADETVESSIVQAMQFLLCAVVALVGLPYSLFGLPSPPRHFVQPKLFLPLTDSHGEKHNLKLEIDLTIMRLDAAATGASTPPITTSTSSTIAAESSDQPAQRPRLRFLSCFTVRTPDASNSRRE
ncbi:hypothetical protein JCM10295v2_002782 [Rhodotorula toruloides]